MSEVGYGPTQAHIGLAQFLDLNGDLGRFPYADCLAQAVLVDAPRLTATERQFLARWCRERATAAAGFDGLPRTPEADFLKALLWQAECLEDSMLAHRFKECLPPELGCKYSPADG